MVCLELLIEEGVKPDHCNIEGITPVMNASAEGEFECLATLLRYDADFHAVDHKGMNALMYAAQCGSFDCANLLVKKGADMAAKSYAEGKTAAHWAVEHTDSAVMEMLVDNGADVYAPDAEGFSVLKLYAASEFATLPLLKKMILGSKKKGPAPSRHTKNHTNSRVSLGGEKLFPGGLLPASVRKSTNSPLQVAYAPPPQVFHAPPPHAPSVYAPQFSQAPPHLPHMTYTPPPYAPPVGAMPNLHAPLLPFPQKPTPPVPPMRFL